MYGWPLYIYGMSIVQVAKLAGLSHATVSRVINDRPGVSDSAAERVRAAMKKLGYSPPAKRRGPVPKDRPNVRSGSVAVLFLGTDRTPMRAPVAALAVDAVESALAELGLNMTLAKVGDDGRLPPAVSKGEVDGLILHGFPPDETVADKLREFPSVWMMSRRTESGDWGDRVAPDNEAVGRMAAEHLIGSGHETLAFLRIEESHRGFMDREHGFVAAVKEAGARCVVLDAACQNPDDAHPSEVDRAALEGVIEELDTKSPRPTALFVPRGRWTFMVYEAMREIGLEPGRDVEVVACDNDPILRALSPAPAAIDIQPDLIGAEAVRQLLRRLEEPDSRSMSRAVLWIQPRLVLPESTLSPGSAV